MDGWFRMTFIQSIYLPSPDVSSLLRDWIHWSQGCTLTQVQDIWDFEMKLNFQILLHLRFVSLCDMNCPSWLQARTWYKRIHDTYKSDNWNGLHLKILDCTCYLPTGWAHCRCGWSGWSLQTTPGQRTWGFKKTLRLLSYTRYSPHSWHYCAGFSWT